jgi:hypothetical protein
MDYLMNSGLDSLNSTILPWDVRQQALIRVLKLGSNLDLMLEPGVKDSFNGLVGILSSPQDSNAAQLIEEFKVYTEALDQSRNQKLSEVFPEVYKVIYAR